MKENLLYYPYINIPASSWTIKSILYWNDVGIIVPPQYIEKPQVYERFTRDLMKSDLVQPVFPGEYIWGVRGFDENFIKLVTQTSFNIEKRRDDFKNGKVSRIHFQKFGEGLLQNLVELGIAFRRDWQWYDIESRAARLLMIYLATIIGETGNFTPATDRIRNLDTSLSQRGSARLSVLRQDLIEELIPYPSNPDLTKLRRFKDRYHEELVSFRILLEKKALGISILKKKDVRDKMQDLVVEEINDKRKKIFSDLNQSKFGQITFGTVFGIAGAAIGFANDNPPLGVFSLLNAVYSSLQGYDRKPILQKDFSYLALVDKTFERQIVSVRNTR